MKVQCDSMHKHLTGLVFIGLLAGCSGNTYGTGVSSEQQLVKDVTSIVQLGRSEKKQPINYASRPELLKAPQVAQLPPPAETVQSTDAGYFPEDPEARRKRLQAELAEAEANGVLPANMSAEVQALRAESLARKKALGITDSPRRNAAVNSDGDCFICDYYERTNRDKERVAQRTAERQQTTVAKRKWLTEPPDTYRVPATTAEAGVVGDEELSDAQIARRGQKKKKSLWKSIFGG